MTRERKWQRTWGTVYNACLRRGWDHGYAAFYANEWQKRQDRKNRCPHCHGTGKQLKKVEDGRSQAD